MGLFAIGKDLVDGCRKQIAIDKQVRHAAKGYQFHHAVGWQLTQGIDGETLFLQGLAPNCFSIGKWLCRTGLEFCAARSDCTGQIAARKGRSHQYRDRERSGRFAYDGNAIGISSEAFNVVEHPFDGSSLVEDAVVARSVVGRFGSQVWMCQETDDALAVVGSDADDAMMCQ